MSDDWEPSWPDLCWRWRCRRLVVHELRPSLRNGVLYTHWTCPRCGHEKEEAAPTDLNEQLYFRAYDDGETTVSCVDRVDGETVWIAGRVVQRWQLVEY